MRQQKAHQLVSILMTSFNTELYIGQAIESILNQTYPNWELLIADDCSTDNTRSIIAKYDDPRIRTYHNEVNLHYLRTRNKLVTQANGDFIALLDADDWYEPNKLELQLNEFERDMEIALCGTLVRYVDKDGRTLKLRDQKPISYDQIRKVISEKSAFTGSTIMVKASAWRSIGGYRDYFSSFGYEDYDLSSRLVEKHKAININKELYVYRQLDDSSSRRNLKYNPFKLHGHYLVKKFIHERATVGSDCLDRNDIPAIINFILDRNRPYLDDPSRLYRELMWSALHRKLYRISFGYALGAVRNAPLKGANYKALILFILITLGVRRE